MAADNPFGYAGYMYDKEIGMYYLMARYYHPVHGVFISVDPDPGDTDDPITQNGYAYANNNPVMLVDPDGNHPILVGIAIVALRILAISGRTQAVKYLKNNLPKILNKVAKNYTIKFNSGNNLVLVVRKGHKGKGGRIFAIDNGPAFYRDKRTGSKKQFSGYWHYHIGDGHYQVSGMGPKGYNIIK